MGSGLLLVLFEPYVNRHAIDAVLGSLGSSGVAYRVERMGEKRVLVSVDDAGRAVSVLRTQPAVSRVVYVDGLLRDRSLEAIVDRAVEVVEGLAGKFATFKVETRRWDKSYPLRSVDVSRAVGDAVSRLGLRVDLEKPELTVFVGIDRDVIVIGHYTAEMVKRKAALGPEVTGSVFAVVERPRMLYEVVDLVQASRALGVEIRLIGGEDVERLLGEALKKLSLAPSSIRVSVAPTAGDALKGAEKVVVLTPYAEGNESLLAKVAAEGGRMALILGNEFEDVSPELRGMADVEVRLGPPMQQPMRTTVALAYALGIVYSVRAGYLKPRRT